MHTQDFGEVGADLRNDGEARVRRPSQNLTEHWPQKANR
jgi:hypothetical protein